MVLGGIISSSCFNIKGVEFTCMATWLPYNSLSVHNREFTPVYSPVLIGFALGFASMASDSAVSIPDHSDQQDDSTDCSKLFSRSDEAVVTKDVTEVVTQSQSFSSGSRFATEV